MKKFIKIGFIYAGFALACGVYFREFTKFNGFTAPTMLSNVHPHLFMLGAVMYLILAIFADRYDLSGLKGYKLFNCTYNFGLILTALLMLVRGTLEVLGTPLTSSASAGISGIAGIGHIVTTVGIVTLFSMLLRIENNK